MMVPFSLLNRSTLANHALCVLATVTANFGVIAETADDEPRLLTGLSATVDPNGVTLTWTVDESRAHRIDGFTCVFRTPGHIKTRVSGAVPCGGEDSSANARERIVTGLPEYGEYLFEVVAQASGNPSISWPKRALNLTVAITEELAGPPGVAVTATGPLVQSCGSEDDDVTQPWRLDQIVSAEHLSHPPGLGWVAGGDSAVAPEWPEPTRFTDLVDEEQVAEILETGDVQAAAATAVTVQDYGNGTKALLRVNPNGGQDLKLHSAYPFGATYTYEESHTVPGWSDSRHAVLWPRLWNRVDCPPTVLPDASHDVALALADSARNGRPLKYSGYGWWTVAPVGVFPQRIVAAKAGLAWGKSTSHAPTPGSEWLGRLTGHLFFNKRR